MKKTAVILCALLLISGTAFAGEVQNTRTAPDKQPPSREQMEKIRKAHEAEFEQKLGLTDEQKAKGKELRQQSFEKMKPIMDDIKNKKQQIRTLRESESLTTKQQKELEKLQNDLTKLKTKANSVRKENMKNFESILNDEQKKILQDLKKEGRQNFERNRKMGPPPDGTCPCPKKFEKND